MNIRGSIFKRAFICQSIVAIIECLERDDWDELFIEPETPNGQADIGFYSNGEFRSAIKVKARANSFSVADTMRYLQELKDAALGVSDICLYLVGDSFTPGSSAFIRANEDVIKTVSYTNLNDIYVGKLVEYIMHSGISRDISIDDIELVGANFFSQLFLKSALESRISRADFDSVLRETLLLRKNNNPPMPLDNMKSPRVFISYSWTNPDYTKKVHKLAERLMSDGVDIILDKWSMRAGQDMDVFMEHSIRDADKVLILCDEGYTLKANERKGGVGKETKIITPEVYGKYDQRKFIPVCMESLQYIPTYLKSTWSVDMTDKNPEGYTDLIGEIFEVDKKPVLGQINIDLIKKAMRS